MERVISWLAVALAKAAQRRRRETALKVSALSGYERRDGIFSAHHGGGRHQRGWRGCIHCGGWHGGRHGSLVPRLRDRADGTGNYYSLYRQDVGRAILLGLEFLIAGDIIRTVVVAPTLQNVIVLGMIVLIRTFLSLSLQLEIEGKLPWRRDVPNQHQD